MVRSEPTLNVFVPSIRSDGFAIPREGLLASGAKVVAMPLGAVGTDTLSLYEFLSRHPQLGKMRLELGLVVFKQVQGTLAEIAGNDRDPLPTPSAEAGVCVKLGAVFADGLQAFEFRSLVEQNEHSSGTCRTMWPNCIK